MWRLLWKPSVPVVGPKPKFVGFNTITKRFVQDESIYQEPLNMRTLKPFPNSRRKSKRKGRGVGSHAGRQCGRGTRAIASKRTDYSPQFEGGRPPFYAFYRFFSEQEKYVGEHFAYIDVGEIILFIKQGLLDPSQPITTYELITKRLIKDPRDGIKLIGRGHNLYNLKLHIETTKATKGAIECVERYGGTFRSVYVDPKILECWANHRDVHHRIECAYDPVTKIPYLINPDIRRRMLQLQQLTGSVLPPSLPPPEKLYYFLNNAHNGYLSKKVISKLIPPKLQSNDSHALKKNQNDSVKSE